MSTGTETRLTSFATPAVFPNRSRILPNAIMPLRSLSPCFTSSPARPEVVDASILYRALTPAVPFSRSCSSPCCIHLAPSSISTLFVMPSHVLRQQTHGGHLRSLVLTSRHHHSPLHCVLQLGEIIFPLQSRLISREMHISAESRRTTSLSSITRMLRYLMENWAPLPRVFHNHKRVRIDET